MGQRDFILRLIEQMGQVLIAIRKKIYGGDDAQSVEDDLQDASQKSGFDLTVVRGLSLDSLLMLVAQGPDIQLDRAWLMAEVLLLDGLMAQREHRDDDAWASLTKAQALYGLIGPQGAMLTGLPELQERMAEVERALEAL